MTALRRADDGSLPLREVRLVRRPGRARRLRARLLVAADGTAQRRARCARHRSVDDTITADPVRRPPARRARARRHRLRALRPDGPTALLPRGDRHYGLVHGVAARARRRGRGAGRGRVPRRTRRTASAGAPGASWHAGRAARYPIAQVVARRIDGPARGAGRQRRADHPSDRRAGLQPGPARRADAGRAHRRRARGYARCRYRHAVAAGGLRRAPPRGPRAHAGVLRRAGAADRQRFAAAAAAAQPRPAGGGSPAFAAGVAGGRRDGLPRRRAGAVPGHAREPARSASMWRWSAAAWSVPRPRWRLPATARAWRWSKPAHPPPWQAAATASTMPTCACMRSRPTTPRCWTELGVWPAIARARVAALPAMRVWDAAGGGELAFDADALRQPRTGLDRRARPAGRSPVGGAAGAGVQLHCPARIRRWSRTMGWRSVALDDGGTRLHARLALAADGADSTLRALAGIERRRPTTTGSAAWSPSSTASTRTRTPAGSVSCRAGRWRSCRSRTAQATVAIAVRSCGRCPMPRPSACWHSTMPRSARTGPRLRRPAGRRCGRSRRGSAFPLRRQLAQPLRWPGACAGGRCRARGASAGRAGREPGPARRVVAARGCVSVAQAAPCGSGARRTGLARWARTRSERERGGRPCLRWHQPPVLQRRAAADAGARPAAGPGGPVAAVDACAVAAGGGALSRT